MKLIGQYDSPFVRRVAVAMRLQGIDYEHLPWSVFADADKISTYNPLLRVPTLVLSEGEALTDSHIIVAYLEAMSKQSLWPEDRGDLASAFRLTSLSTGAADKAVSLVYEQLLHDHTSAQWIDRCEMQVGAALDILESARAAAGGNYLFGEQIGHADIALACAWRFIGEAHAERFDFGRWPAVRKHSEKCEAQPSFAECVQPFHVTLRR
jgi:glutathione S-transferase